MNQYRMPVWNTCTQCSRPIKAGEPVYAEDENQVVSGGGLCTRCANPQPAPSREEVAPSLAGVSKVVKKSKRTVSTETVEGS